MTRRKNKRLRLIPSHLPLIRDKLADFAQYRLRKLGSQTQYEAMMANAWSMTDQIRTAQLWWVSRDMTRLAEDTVQAGDYRLYDVSIVLPPVNAILELSAVAFGLLFD